MKQTCT